MSDKKAPFLETVTGGVILLTALFIGMAGFILGLVIGTTHWPPLLGIVLLVLIFLPWLMAALRV